jgi:colicin import membrane protein
MHPKFTLAILIFGISGIAKGQTSRPDSAKTSGKEKVTTYQQGHVYDIMIVNGKITGLEVDNKPIDPADFHRYDSIVQAIKAEMREDNDHEQEERAEQKRDWEQAQRDQEQEARDRVQEVKDRAQEKLDREQEDRDREQENRDREQDRQQAIKDREQGERDREQGQRDREQGERDKQQGQRDREQGERDRKEAEAERRMMQDLLDDLVTEKIAPDVKSINSVVLTDTELVVNDKKQSPQLQQKMKDKYGKWAKCGISYGCCETSGTMIHFSK